jgi:mannitol/fructose-specific phosphotransferase system IIA component (Ntr-type)
MSIAIGLSVLDPSLYIPELRPRRKDSALLEMAGRAHQAGALRDFSLLSDLLTLRERAGSTAIGKGVAVPHARSIAVIDPRLLIARSRRGIDWGAADEQPVHLVLLALAPAETSEEFFHDLVARTVAIARLQRNRQKLADAASFDAVAAVMREVTA